MVCASGEVFIPFCNLISVPLPRMGRVYPIQFCLIGDEDCALVLKKAQNRNGAKWCPFTGVNSNLVFYF